MSYLKMSHRKFLKFFRISLGIFLLLSLLLSGCSINTVSWRFANTNTKSSLIKQAVQDNTKLNVNSLSQAKVAKIKHNLFLIDYNSKALCGYFGCLYSLYQVEEQESRGKTPLNTPHYQHLWSAYFQPYHPPGMPLFSLSEDSHYSEYPCLQVNQIDENYLALTYCFDGKTYSLKDSRSFLKPINN